MAPKFFKRLRNHLGPTTSSHRRAPTGLPDGGQQTSIASPSVQDAASEAQSTRTDEIPTEEENTSFNLSWDELAAAFSRIGTMRPNLLLDTMALRELMDLGQADEGAF